MKDWKEGDLLVNFNRSEDSRYFIIEFKQWNSDGQYSAPTFYGIHNRSALAPFYIQDYIKVNGNIGKLLV